MHLHLKSNVAAGEVRVQAFEALVQEVAGRAGSFQAEHATLGEDFLGYRLRVAGQMLSLSHRPTSRSALVAIHQSTTGTRRYCLEAGAWASLRPRIEATVDMLHGHELEQDLTLAAREPLHADGTVVFQDRWWDHWQDHPHDSQQSLGAHYKHDLHPLIHALAEGQLFPRLPEHPRILDLGGGTGSLLMRMGRWGHLVDRNARQLAAAEARPDACFEVHAGDIRALPDFAAVVGGPVHLALAIGSLHLHVMEPTQAWKLAHGLFGDLAPGGYLVAAGHSPLLLNRDDLELIGFEVHNCIVPGRDDKGRRQQLYLARRPPGSSS